MAGQNENRSYIEVTGMVIGSRPIGEHDRRVVLLTKERGKISAFARGARRPNSALVAATGLFCYGRFRLFSGRDAYTLTEAYIDNYFEFFRTHVEEAAVASYFLEVMEYITRENNDEAALLLLTYASLRALENGKVPISLVRNIFEIRTVVIEGEFMEPNPGKYSDTAMYALRYIATAPVGRLYGFTLEEEAAEEIAHLAARYMEHSYAHHFVSLDVIAAMGY